MSKADNGWLDVNPTFTAHHNAPVELNKVESTLNHLSRVLKCTTKQSSIMGRFIKQQQETSLSTVTLSNFS